MILTFSTGLVSVNLPVTANAQNNTLSQRGNGNSDQQTEQLQSSEQNSQVGSGDSSILSGNNVFCQNISQNEIMDYQIGSCFNDNDDPVSTISDLHYTFNIQSIVSPSCLEVTLLCNTNLGFVGMIPMTQETHPIIVNQQIAYDEDMRTTFYLPGYIAENIRSGDYLFTIHIFYNKSVSVAGQSFETTVKVTGPPNLLLKCNEFQSGTNLGLVDCTGQSKEGLLERDFDVDILFETKPI
jgi:hypothetical protein